MTTEAMTTEVLSRFKGGQIEVQNSNEGYMYRGEIDDVEVTGEGQDATITVTLVWFAQMVDHEWVAAEARPYSISMLIYTASDIGDGRLCLNSWVTGETTVFFPPGGSALDRAKVRGLE